MPTMKEIYQHHADAYDELVSHEDYEKNLSRFLLQRFDFSGKSVIEMGAGTGRLTALYIEQAARALCCDGSSHMLQRGEENLASYRDKLAFRVCDNLDVGELEGKADYVVEGWSFGHTVIDHFERAEQIVEQLVMGCRRLLVEGGTLIFVETMGSNREEAGPPREELAHFYELLEHRYGFQREVLRTDYRFASPEEAFRVFSFFFGEQHCQGLVERNSSIIKEYTGVWYWRG
ncbi:MAG: class I SAM-dependent methyltransferase [Myxococcales bacterium]|nr:class I SAM-dependent methyltransferase [Myxococcales bacterium]